MTQEPNLRATIRKYLLAQLTDPQRDAFEQLLLSDDATFEELLVVEDELIDEYLRDKLDGKEKAGFESYFLATDERQQKLRFGRAFMNYLSAQTADKPIVQVKGPAPGWWTQLFASPARIAAYALVILGVGLATWQLFFRQSDVDKGLVALNAAYREQRPLEARISKLDYAPYSVTRGPGTDRVNVSELRRAELVLVTALENKPTPAVHHALGKVYLAQKKFDQAIGEFEEALKGDPNNAQVYADLGAALLERGKTEIDPSSSQKMEDGKGVKDLSRSLDNLNKALDLNPNLLEALFNRALVNRYLALLPQAKEDWRKYLEKDPNSKWSEEALENLKLVEEELKRTSQNKDEILEEFLRYVESRDGEAAWKLVGSYHNRSGNVVVEQLLDSFLEKAAKGQDGEASRVIQILSDIGKAETEKAGDVFLTHLAYYYQSTSVGQQAVLARAREMVKAGHKGWGQARGEETFELFKQARPLFAQAGDRYESAIVDYWLSFCYYRQHDEEQSLAILDPLILNCENNGYKHLLARALYLAAAVQFNLNEHSRAVGLALRSLDLAEQMNDAVGMLNALSSLIEYFRYLGNYEKSLAYLQRSLPLVRSISLDPVQGSRHYGFAATAFAAAGLYASAAEYQKQALRFALTVGNASVISYNYSFLAAVNGKLRRYDEALENSQTAYQVAEDHSNEASDRELMAYALLQMGHIYRQSENFDKAIASYDKSIEIYESLGHATNLYQAHKGRFLCHFSQRDDALANKELQTTLKLVEGYRDKIFEENNRSNFFDAEQSLYDLAIDFEYSRMRDPLESFERCEFSRARSLLDLIYSDAEVLTKSREPEVIPRSVSSPLSHEEIVRRLPEQTQILQYAVLEDKLLIWVVSKQGILSTATRVSRKELTDKVLGYLRVASSYTGNNKEETITRAQELFEVLIKPVESWLDPSKRICIVPDKVLSHLPFAALVSTSSGKYLIEHYHVLLSPSSTIFIVSSEIAREKNRAMEERLASIGNPQFDRAVFPSYQDLPSAAREAVEVAACYKSPRRLTEEQATVSVVKSEMEKSSVIHFALHFALDERFPLRSKMLLAKDPKERSDTPTSEAVLYAHDIYAMKLPRTRLVVLSSCQTGAERYYGGEGMLSMARPFIAARVPMVVATLWPVDSNATAELMINFHKNRKRKGVPTVEALRSAQLDMLRSADGRFQQPYYWAPFVVIGGYANY